MRQITQKEFTDLVNYVKKNYGVNLTHKKSLVAGRLINYLSENHYASFTDYMNHIISDKTGQAAVAMIDRLTTNHTYFMRENQHFDYFRNNVLPYLERACGKKKDMGIWSAGCSTGQEPYTLAMLMEDYFGTSKSEWDTTILATDISTKALNRAAAGNYTKDDLSALPEKWKKKYFTFLTDENYKICDRISKEVIFRRFNLMTEQFPFRRKFHVIFCRNVMIYFDAATKRQLINKFYESTEEGGFLFIGHSESIGREESGYRCVMPAVYKK
ncbi:chemotaxis protein methyltransferase [Ruminiclostridium hungatei]|uniref:protein-glutamate O-methyltransferase n=1 Tax=Ruminiclostridium hungatei TaxID=48256 RepID=A0A1V4SQW2_RUMHU|nr:protein-glutamate O-methyltransferase CheR [Ruminiclostridium hungatei]OPX45846.1 chemotaxis protein methyltransferase [Ruminiclostridium hungatei]